MQTMKRRGFLESGRVIFIGVSEIHPNPAQPRKVFDPEGLEELSASIIQYGIIQPLSVRKVGEKYELIAGERRLRAARMAGLSEVPCIIMGIDEEQSGMIALVENLQRRDLDFIEEAEGLARLMRLYGLSQEQAAVKVGKSQSAVANKLRLLRHSPIILRTIRQKGLTERHARALLRLEEERDRCEVLDHIVRYDLNVAKTEQYIEHVIRMKSETDKPKKERTLIVKDIRLFLNTIEHNLEIMKNSGVHANCGKSETEEEIILTIRIPKRTQTF